MMFFYRLCWSMLALFIPLYLRVRLRKGKEDRERLHERYGLASAARPGGTLIWIHAASVGETQSVLPLIERMLRDMPWLFVLLTTGTRTSAQMVASKKISRLIHQYIPLDRRKYVARFLHHWHPDCALWVESEFWPEMLIQTHTARIPSLLINARISERSVRRWQRAPLLAKRLLAGFSTIVASSDEDAARLMLLGAPYISQVANLKYDAPALPCDASSLGYFTSGLGDRPSILIASTHKGEEELLIDALAPLYQSAPNVLTVIVPRHAERGEWLTAHFRNAGWQVAQRSGAESLAPTTQIYIADTMGELGLFFRACGVVVMGGSFIPQGGHNLLEPARLKCAIITGPFMHNFHEMTAHMLAHEALWQVASAAELAEACFHLLSDPAHAGAMGKKAWQLATKSQGAGELVLQVLKPILEKKSYA